MPLVKSCSQDAFDANVSQLVKDGYEQKQALAIAFSTLRKSCGVPKDAPERMTTKEILKAKAEELGEASELRVLAEVLRDEVESRGCLERFLEALPRGSGTKEVTPDEMQQMFGPISKAMAKAIAARHNQAFQRQQKFGGQCDKGCAAKHKDSRDHWVGDTPQEKYKHCIVSRTQCCDDDADEAKEACAYILK